MSRNRFIPCILALLCLILLVPNVGSAQTDKVKASMAALKAETAKLGAPKVEGSDLYFGKTKASNELVDAVVKKHGGSASLFVKNGDQYMRVATTLSTSNSNTELVFC